MGRRAGAGAEPRATRSMHPQVSQFNSGIPKPLLDPILAI
jgi:hypothetical protein